MLFSCFDIVIQNLHSFGFNLEKLSGNVYFRTQHSALKCCYRDLRVFMLQEYVIRNFYSNIYLNRFIYRVLFISFFFRKHKCIVHAMFIILNIYINITETYCCQFVLFFTYFVNKVPGIRTKYL